jgi:hypothetical protein
VTKQRITCVRNATPEAQAGLAASTNRRWSILVIFAAFCGMLEVMTRMLAMLLVVVAVSCGVEGCAARSSGAPAEGAPASPAGESTPSFFDSVSRMPSGGLKSIPNPGAGAGNALLARALLPQSAPGREAGLLVPPAVVALPDRDLRSLFIGLRQYASPVAGPRACDEWTAGLSRAVLSDFNLPGVQLGIEESTQPPDGRPMFSETIVTAPPPVLRALADPPLPAACRNITTPPYPGGVKPGTVTAPAAVGERIFEITGTGKFPVWQWAEVIGGKGFLLEIRIPNQSGDPEPGAALPTVASSAYHRAAAILTPSGR